MNGKSKPCLAQYHQTVPGMGTRMWQACIHWMRNLIEVSYSKSMEKGSDRPLTRPNILAAISLGGTNACGEKNYTKLSAHIVCGGSGSWG